MADEWPEHPIKLDGKGNMWFEIKVHWVLDQLKEKLPNRYAEFIRYMPKVEYNEELLRSEGPHHRVYGRANGLLSIDGSYGNKDDLINGKVDDEHRKESAKQWYLFLYVLLHEVGHNVRGRRDGDWSEDAANKYAETVLDELGWKK